jgi:hypothetical protein
VHGVLADTPHRVATWPKRSICTVRAALNFFLSPTAAEPGIGAMIQFDR